MHPVYFFARWRLPAAAMLALAAPHAGAAPVYQFSPVNQYNLQLTAAYWNPIMQYVSEKSGVRLQLKVGRTSADTTSYVLAQEVDFAFTNHLFSPDRMRMGWRVLARRDAAPVRAQIVTLADGPIRELRDLAGADVAFPGPEALVAYKVNYAELLRQNVPVDVIYAGNMDGAFAQLASGKVKAVGANSQLAAAVAARNGLRLRVLWQSAPFADLALMVSPRVPAAQAEAVARAFIGMAGDERGKRVLAEAAAAVKTPPFSFVPVREGDYDAYHDFYSRAPAKLR
ncbi:phosphate/phosphite/phosphonate ABC transporter substrate-binding protein [Oxalobacteraceae bacterium A2-2]